MLVNKVQVIVQCQECGNDEFYRDNEGTYYCTSCNIPHETDDFNLSDKTLQFNIEIDD